MEQNKVVNCSWNEHYLSFALNEATLVLCVKDYHKLFINQAQIKTEFKLHINSAISKYVHTEFYIWTDIA